MIICCRRARDRMTAYTSLTELRWSRLLWRSRAVGDAALALWTRMLAHIDVRSLQRILEGVLRWARREVDDVSLRLTETHRKAVHKGRARKGGPLEDTVHHEVDGSVYILWTIYTGICVLTTRLAENHVIVTTLFATVKLVSYMHRPDPPTSGQLA